MITPAIRRRRVGSSVRLTVNIARNAAAIAISAEATTSEASYSTAIGSWSASMPTKCMLQMPSPMAVEA